MQLLYTVLLLIYRPLVMDPANPTNNVCSKFDWEEIKKAARKVLDSPMMRGVTSHTWALETRII